MAAYLSVKGRITPMMVKRAGFARANAETLRLCEASCFAKVERGLVGACIESRAVLLRYRTGLRAVVR